MVGMSILAALAAAGQPPAPPGPPAHPTQPQVQAQAARNRAIPLYVGGRAVRGPAPGWRYGWPGTYFEGRFEGHSVAVWVDSPTEHLRLLVDGEEKLLLKGAGSVVTTLTRLGPGAHVVRLEKLTESQTGGGRLIGFFAGEGGKPLPPAPRPRRI